MNGIFRRIFFHLFIYVKKILTVFFWFVFFQIFSSNEESILNTFAASMIGGVFIAIFMAPFDTISTRLYNQGKYLQHICSLTYFPPYLLLHHKIEILLWVKLRELFCVSKNSSSVFENDKNKVSVLKFFKIIQTGKFSVFLYYIIFI